MGSLSGSQFEKIHQAILDGFSEEKLERLLRFKLNIRLDHVVQAGTFSDVVYNLIDYFEQEDTTAKFILAIQQANPNNSKIIALSQELNLMPENTPGIDELEKLVKKTNSYLDPLSFYTKLGPLLHQVCHIDVLDAVGTGFLVGPDLVLTNYHVVDEIITSPMKSKDVIVRFDYFVIGSGKVVDDGTPTRLHEDWLICSSPYSKVDEEPVPKSGLPGNDELDFALIRLEKGIGDLPVVKGPGVGGNKRGWVTNWDTKHKFKKDSPIFILQHPAGKRMRLALDTDSVIGLNQNCTRIRYTTNTEGGSSGSPCLNQNLELVALHHSGDPKKRLFSKPEWNEGIPIKAITNYLKENKMGHLIP